MPRRLPNPVILLLVALPLATLAAGVATLAIIGRGGLDAVADPVRRTAQVQQVDVRADEAARTLGLAGELRLDGDRLRLQLDGPAMSDQRLLLQLEHPLDAGKDQRLELRATEGHWAATAFDPAIGWRIALVPVDGRWRLVGRWPRHGAGATLEPALSFEDRAGAEGSDGPG